MGKFNPKAFISYNWSSKAHEARVLDLATALRESKLFLPKILDALG